MTRREELSAYAYSYRQPCNLDWREDNTNKFGLILGLVVLAVALAAAPIPLTTNVGNPPQTVTIYPNLLFAVPLMLLGALLLLYGAVAGKPEKGGSTEFK
jgi:peptidoglycan/LPS O-acetylase OafA/YrhL